MILTDTSDPLLYLLVYSSIHLPPLFYTSSDVFQNLPTIPIYNLIEFPPDEQITPRFFLPIKRIEDIYISYGKFVLDRPVIVEFWLSFSHCHAFCCTTNTILYITINLTIAAMGCSTACLLSDRWCICSYQILETVYIRLLSCSIQVDNIMNNSII